MTVVKGTAIEAKLSHGLMLLFTWTNQR